MRKLLAVLLLIPTLAFTQERDVISIHQEQSEYYSPYSQEDVIFFDSINGFTGIYRDISEDSCSLSKRVFGFHPYWIGSAYLNYRWNLLSDLCYFSYEVDPATGYPTTIHGWLTDPVIDSAQAHGVRVHLCVTLFSGHSAFFNSPAAQQNLVDSVLALVQLRNADGINIDFEAVPAAYRTQVTAFMADLSVQYHALSPQGLLSIDLPAVDWSNVFEVEAIQESVDLFFVMGYDYYWNGSGTAGPVGPLYAMTDTYNYSLCRTISEYQWKGMVKEKFVLGLPYYGRLWKTLSNQVPSGVIGYGTALTYANVRNNAGGNFSPGNHYWEDHSISSCYIYSENSDWHQCFIHLQRDMEERYDLVNYRGLAGIGIWALGYDNGHEELWDAIRRKLTDCAVAMDSDTIYDCGGPAWNYYNNEEYSFIIEQPLLEALHLQFNDFGAEAGYDSLFVYAGLEPQGILMGAYSGATLPSPLSTDQGAFTLYFHSDGLTTSQGWEAIWHNGSLAVTGDVSAPALEVAPNPFHDQVTLILPATEARGITIVCRDMLGRNVPVHYQSEAIHDTVVYSITFPSGLPGDGLFLLTAYESDRLIGSVKLIRE